MVELVGLTAAAIATAAAIRHIKGSSERYSLPVSLAALKLPTGAITAFLGLLLMRGQFVRPQRPGHTRANSCLGAGLRVRATVVHPPGDQQGQTVLDNVRGADRPQPTPSPP